MLFASLTAASQLVLASPLTLNSPPEVEAAAASGAAAASDLSTVVYHLHIPGTVEPGFGREVLAKYGKSQLSESGCQANIPSGVWGTMALVRAPQRHLSELHSICRSPEAKAYRAAAAAQAPNTPKFPETFLEWIRAWRRLQDGRFLGNFTPSSAEEALALAAASSQSLLLPLAPNAAGGSLLDSVNLPYQCYSPINPLSHRLRCHRPAEMQPICNDIIFESFVQKFLVNTTFLGLADFPEASLCLLDLMLARRTNALPQDTPPSALEYCNRGGGGSSSSSSSAGGSGSSADFSNLSQQELSDVYYLTFRDVPVYQRAVTRFLADVREMEGHFGISVLSDGEQVRLRKLRKEQVT